MTTTNCQRELRSDSGDNMRLHDEGETFIITRNGTPVGELSPLRRRRFVTADTVAELFRQIPPIDAAKFRSDLDAVVSQDTEPRGLTGDSIAEFWSDSLIRFAWNAIGCPCLSQLRFGLCHSGPCFVAEHAQALAHTIVWGEVSRRFLRLRTTRDLVRTDYAENNIDRGFSLDDGGYDLAPSVAVDKVSKITAGRLTDQIERLSGHE